MISIYSDAAFVDGHAACATFIINDTTYLGFFTKVYTQLLGSIHSELLAIKQGLDYIYYSHIDQEDITVYTDSEEALRHLNHATKGSKLDNLVQEILEYTKLYNISFSYIKGHQVAHNPNKVVDSLARHINYLLISEVIT